MFELKRNSVRASAIAAFLERELIGADVEVDHPSSYECFAKHSMLFLGNRVLESGKVDFSSFQKDSTILIFVPEKFAKKLECPHIASPNPRVDFVRCIEQFFIQKPDPGVHPSAIVEAGCRLGKDVLIGANVHIGPSVIIGDRTMIFDNVVIAGNVRIGDDCVIKPQAVIGSEGFSFVAYGERLLHFPQVGLIEIGNRVWIGSNSCVERAALESTTIEDDVKVDDLVQIGHNCTVGASSQIASGVVICGRARIGKSVWLAPNVSVNSEVEVGDGAFVGMGSVVMKNVESHTVVVGNPARFIKNTSELPTFQ